MNGTEVLLAAAGVLAGVAATVAIQRVRMADGRLLGTWRSDADRTVAEWRERRPMTDDQAADLAAVIRPARVTWGRRTYSVDVGGRREEHPYRVVARDGRSVVIRTYDPLEEREVFATIHFTDADSYWVHAESVPMRDYFRRVE
jgi:hypothetical protein